MSKKKTQSVQSEPALPGQLVNGKTLLEVLFQKSSRPSIRWLYHQQKLRRIPFQKIGRLTYFDVEQVRAEWRDRFTVNGSTSSASHN